MDDLIHLNAISLLADLEPDYYRLIKINLSNEGTTILATSSVYDYFIKKYIIGPSI